jgi:diguanylate cyclase (GGDEF)-like protein
LSYIQSGTISEGLRDNQIETYYEQLGMFDDLGLRPNLSDMLLWEVEWGAQKVRIFNSDGSVVASFPLSEMTMRISPESISRLRLLVDSLGAGRRQSLDINIDISISGAWKRYHLKGLIDRTHGAMFASGVALDMDAFCRQKQRLEFLETHDPLTGLANFSSFESQYNALARFGTYPLALVIFRIDNLSEVCSTLGVQAGNTMICNVAQVIQECFFDADIIGRAGGGEYCCLFTGKAQLEIETYVGEANIRLHSAYLNLIKAKISCGYAIAEYEMDFSQLYHRAHQKLIWRRNIQKHLSGPSVIDCINAIISRKTGWGKRVIRLQGLAVQMAKALMCTEETISDIKLLAKLADIGLIGIDDRLLAQRLRLSPEDQRIYDAHFEVGREIIISIDSLAQMENLYIDLYKRYDAWQDAIAMPSRIVAVVRGFDDLMLAGEKMTYKELSQKMAAARGTLYCPEIVDVLMDIARKYHTWPARSRKR